ncbi:MAG: hypothetical protein ACYC6G_03725 [Desulfobaccales bacterium]
MIAHTHPHGHGGNKAPHGHPTELWRGRGLHKDWRTWAVIALMLAAIGTYVFTLDEAIQPGGAATNAGVTAVAPANPSK